MRGLAEMFGEELAPGLSNRIRDARWFTILAWCLEQGCAAWRLYGASGGDGLTARSASRDLYSWVRPLEALWLARTVVADDEAGKGRQLPGVRSVRRWLEDGYAPERFGFAASSYDRYRFTGIYGAYRIGLRRLPDLTLGGDGWRVGSAGRELAALAAEHATAKRAHRRGKGRRPTPESYWRKAFRWKSKEAEFLPTRLNNPTKLPAQERALLRGLLFSAKGSPQAERRLAVVRHAEQSGADDRVELFRHIADRLVDSVPVLGALPSFCALAEAGVAAMNAVWGAVGRASSETGYPAIADVVSDPEVEQELERLAEASERWQKQTGAHFRVPDALAAALVAAGGSRTKELHALERHHRQYGGGLPWVGISGGRVMPLAPLRGGRTSDYRFRIDALCRLGVQCGVIGEIPQVYVVSDDVEAAE